MRAHKAFTANFKVERVAELKRRIKRWNSDSQKEKNPYSEPEKRRTFIFCAKHYELLTWIH